MTAPDGQQPAQPDEFLLQIRVRGITYSSPPVSLDGAEQLLKATRRELMDIGDSYGLVEFEASGYPQLWLRARQVSALQIVPRHPGRRGSDRAQASGFATGGPVVAEPLPLGGCVMPSTPVLDRQQIPGRVIGS